MAVAGVIDDLRSRKFHNWLFALCCVAGIAVAFAIGGISSLMTGCFGFVCGIALTLPLVLLRVLGGGDMKLLAAMGLVIGWSALVNVLVFSILWGALFGVVRAISGGKARALTFNMFSLVALRDRQGLELNTMPFTFAILIGWLSVLAAGGGVV
jgi:prepilin peptidase CpaA